VEGDVSIDSEALFMINFVNLKIKLAQSFGCTHMDRVYVCIFIGISAHSICIYTVFLKKYIKIITSETSLFSNQN
jgi:hypothetical protein